MALVTGTTGSETLYGTPQDDTISSRGGVDTMIGYDGADTYQIYQYKSTYNPVSGYHAIIDDQGTDGAIDTITGARGLYHSASFGYSGWAHATHVGDDLIIELPGRPYRFRKAAIPAYTIEIKGHYADNAVEHLVIGTTTYNLATSGTGSSFNDIIAGTSVRDIIHGYEGDDFIDANVGWDKIWAGAGNDTVFAGNGNDRVVGGLGDDRLYAGSGNDVLKANAGSDWIYAGDGADKIWGGTGNDVIFGGDGADKIKAGAGRDLIEAGHGDAYLRGAKDGDTYRIGYDSTTGSFNDWGNITIDERGDTFAPKWVNGSLVTDDDTILLWSQYPSAGYNVGESLARLETDRVGDDMIFRNISAGGGGEVTVLGQFGPNWQQQAIERIVFSGGYYKNIELQVRSAELDQIGDDRGISGAWNEFIFGSDTGEDIFGDSGLNIIWTGGGADRLIYKESDAIYTEYSDGFWYSGIRSFSSIYDVVMDFDVTKDRLDFSEIKYLKFADLVLGEDAEGDATIAWLSGDFEVANISIELRGVSLVDLTEDLFIFKGTGAPALLPAAQMEAGLAVDALETAAPDMAAFAVDIA